MAPYNEPASKSGETTAPGAGRGPEAGRGAGLQEARPAASNATAAARLTCSTSNPGVSFARSHAQREPRRSDHRRLPPPRARRRGRHGRSVPRPTPAARDVCVQGIAVAARERPHGGETPPAGGRVRLAGRAPGGGPHLRLRRSGRPLLPRSRMGRRQVPRRIRTRSEEHTSELQSHVNLVCRLLLEKKNETIVVNLIDGQLDSQTSDVR